ncbi:TPA: hypothetical protein ACUB1K_003539 [Klebsiella michiganensis]|uniref:hypothetical protein n=1 Tax=Klebsiella michiganensis TaxID=1134687 RepID=UPI001B9A0842|nr:hypothetical protein [Raoultella planticola]
MARNKIKISQYIFKSIHDSASAQDSTYLADSNARWLTPKDSQDLTLMMDAEVEVLTLGKKIHVVSIKHEQDTYFCFIGLTIPERLPSELDEIESTPGLFSCVIYCVGLQAIATPSQARDVLEQQYRGQEGYNGHELKDITILFPDLYFVKANGIVNTSYLNNVERVAGAFIASGYDSNPLDINNDLKLRIQTLFEAGEDTIPYSLPLQGLLSYNWQSLFLDLYRCLEQLYTALKLKSLVAKITYQGTLADLAYLLEDELSWRPKEQDALASILAHSSEATRIKIHAAFLVNIADITDFSASRCASFIYKLRNSHVHFRPAMKAETKKTDEWNGIILAMCDAVDEIYGSLGKDFLR